MKLDQKKQAQILRRQGVSITRIADVLNVSKGSVSLWVRDIKLSENVRQQILNRSHSIDAVKKRRVSRLKSESDRRLQLVEAARAAVGPVSPEKLFLIGISLYWGEGSKRKRGVLEFTNGDPYMIKVMMKFFKKVQQVPAKKFRGHVYVHDHIDKKVAEQYWSAISGISLDQFHKTSVQKNRKRLPKDTLPFGTFAIVVCDTQKKLQMDGWIKGVADRVGG